MYIGKVKLSNEWQKLEDVIKAQVEGQSGFAFSNGKDYQLQGEGNYAVRLCDSSALPADAQDGERIAETQTAIYQKDNSSELYVRTEQDIPSGNVWLKISEIGA